MTSAKILADSINPMGIRLTSFLLTYPRFIHAEFMTHRVFSRNAASSRAIPFRKMLDSARDNMAAPAYWGAEQKGMQAGGQLDRDEAGECELDWRGACEGAMHWASLMWHRGLHKSICNRLLEPFTHITVLATASNAGLANFFALRAHPAAEPTFQELAFRMLGKYIESEPAKLEWGEWHVPAFEGGYLLLNSENAIKIATARCARLSYLTHDGQHDADADIALHDRLASSGHWSPFEHCAQAVDHDHIGAFKSYPWSNFDNLRTFQPSGWGQYRKLFDEEDIREIDLTATMAAKPEWITL